MTIAVPSIHLNCLNEHLFPQRSLPHQPHTHPLTIFLHKNCLICAFYQRHSKELQQVSLPLSKNHIFSLLRSPSL